MVTTSSLKIGSPWSARLPSGAITWILPGTGRTGSLKVSTTSAGWLGTTACAAGRGPQQHRVRAGGDGRQGQPGERDDQQAGQRGRASQPPGGIDSHGQHGGRPAGKGATAAALRRDGGHGGATRPAAARRDAAGATQRPQQRRLRHRGEVPHLVQQGRTGVGQVDGAS